MKKLEIARALSRVGTDRKGSGASRKPPAWCRGFLFARIDSRAPASYHVGMDPRTALIPPLSDRHRDVLRRVYGDGVFPETHADGIADVPFLDREALIRAGMLQAVRRGHYRGYRVTAEGLVWLADRGP